MRTIVVVLAISLGLPVAVLAHCHNDSECENLEKHLISHERWDKPYQHSNRIDFWTKAYHYSSPPHMYPDVNIAAGTWTDISFNGTTVKFKLRNRGDTEQEPTNHYDNQNTIGWSDLDSGHLGKTVTRHHRKNNRMIVEQDMILNYYEPLIEHSGHDSEHYCLRAVITHEFGHFIRLLDVEDGKPPDDNCTEYRVYTMWEEAMKDEGAHDRESLACEDKYGAWFTYNHMPWAAPSAVSSIQRQLPLEDTTGEVLATRLLQNFPDPFNPETWIPYELADNVRVTMEIYDTTGELVRTFRLGFQEKGRYTDKSKALYWDGRNHAGEKVHSGVYFYRLLAGDVSETRKLVVVK